MIKTKPDIIRIMLKNIIHRLVNNSRLWFSLIAINCLLLLFSCERNDMFSFAENRLSIGDTGPAGGIVFYVTDGGLHGLEVAPLSTEWTGKQWGPIGTLITGTATGTGSGETNTYIVAAWLNANAESDRAAQLCIMLENNNYNDWFLPSKDELNLIYINLTSNGLGDMTASYYWSSSEETLNAAWGQDFSTGSQYSDTKDFTSTATRAVREF